MNCHQIISALIEFFRKQIWSEPNHAIFCAGRQLILDASPIMSNHQRNHALKAIHRTVIWAKSIWKLLSSKLARGTLSIAIYCKCVGKVWDYHNTNCSFCLLPVVCLIGMLCIGWNWWQWWPHPFLKYFIFICRFSKRFLGIDFVSRILNLALNWCARHCQTIPKVDRALCRCGYSMLATYFSLRSMDVRSTKQVVQQRKCDLVAEVNLVYFEKM